MSFDINDYYVVDFHFIDDHRCLQPLSESNVIGESPLKSSEVEYKRNELSKLFKKSGWEGDGEINCMFLAPFFAGRDDGHCEIIYHVKQSNNGTSWVAVLKGLRVSIPEPSLAAG
jgi:hypothetical protein